MVVARVAMVLGEIVVVVVGVGWDWAFSAARWASRMALALRRLVSWVVVSGVFSMKKTDSDLRFFA